MNRERRELKRRLGAAIRERRRRLSLTQADLAERAGVNRSHLSLIESGEHLPTRKTIAEIARALDTTPEELEWTGEFLENIAAGESGLYPGLAELLQDPREVMKYRITDEEKMILRTIRLQWRNPSKQFFIDALLDYRMSKEREKE